MSEISFGHLIWIFSAACVVNNFTLSYFLGLCPFLGMSGRIDTALRMGAATTFVMLVTSCCAWFLNTYILPYAPYLRLICFIVVIASTVQFVEMLIKKLSPALFRALGIYLPLITTNCAVLGMAVLSIQQGNNLLRTAFFAFGAAVGFAIAIVLFAGIRERLDLVRVPASLKGAPIGLITAGILSLGFMGFANLVKG